MRAIWKGAVSFGLVAIAVKLYSATEEKDIRFHQVHPEDGGRISYQRVCKICGKQLTFDQIAKGLDVGGGELVILTDEDLADLPLASSHSIEVLEFVPAEQIDPILYSKSYYLEPDGAAGVKPYLLLRDSLAQAGKIGVVKVALRQREQLAAMRVRDNVLVLNTMLWPDEVRDPAFGFLEKDVDLRKQELQMAASLIESMAGEFHPDEFTDSYREALQQVIDAKVAGKEVVAAAEPETEPGEVIDLMAALKASVERGPRGAQGRAGRGARRTRQARRQEGRREEGGTGQVDCGEEGRGQEGCVMSHRSGSLAA
ncbi:DNA end-binding protein Ku [Allocatelliglobosispora scoriae]|uniref:Non-homologous end joining protein Ku n=1 Tax=Allocatelliglobosispora scoriae TaxID=643052 RepID=A0A841BUH8_9ACTN|nr:DNA end-binding protein Ku [Allocatelliglobosispora scoriae]